MPNGGLLGALRDVGQGASNSVAATVSGPVDMLAWLLRKGGVPVPSNAFGGSEWMRQQGLTAEPQNKVAGLLGEQGGLLGNVETVPAGGGLLSGVLPAVYSYGDTMKRKLAALLADPAGTIGLGVARAGEDQQNMVNLAHEAGYMPGSRSVLVSQQQRDAAQRELARQGAEQAIQAATVWHGSPHKFDRFDSSKIGTGEGAQAYGHGLYLAESPSVAKSYADTLSQYHIGTRDGMKSGGDFADALVANAGDYPASLSSAIRSQANKVATDLAGGKTAEQVIASMRNGPYARMYAGLADAVEKMSPTKAGGSLYKVDLPDTAIAKMLDWDKPLSQQAPEVQKALANTKNKHLRAVVDYASSPYSMPGLEGEVKTMGEAIKLLGMNQSPAKGSQMLAKQGIPGIRYLDGGSRGAGAGTSNYVVFPGEESALTILERNGTPINRLVQALKGTP